MNISIRDNAVASKGGNIFAALESGAEDQNGLMLTVEERSSSVSRAPYRQVTRAKTRSDLRGDTETAGEITAAPTMNMGRNSTASTCSTASTRVPPCREARDNNQGKSVNISEIDSGDNTEPSLIRNDEEGVETETESQYGSTSFDGKRFSAKILAPHRREARAMRQSALHGDMQTAGEITAAAGNCS